MISKETVDFLLSILKFASIIIGSISGVVGLSIDFRNKRTHKITKNGYVVLYVIVISCFVSVLVQSFELIKEKKTNAANKVKEADQTKKTNTILTNIERSLYPFKDISVMVEVQHPIEKDLLPFINRINNSVFKRAEKDYIISTRKSKITPQGLNIYPDRKKDPFAYQLLSLMDLEVNIYKKIDIKDFINLKNKNQDATIVGDASLNLFSDPKATINTATIDVPDSAGNHKFIENEVSYKIEDKVFTRKAQIKSSLDLAKCTIVISIANRYSKDYKFGKRLTGCFRKALLEDFVLTIDNLSLLISNFDTYEDSLHNKYYVYKFPPDVRQIQL
jgi:hypothetical protein